MKLFKHLFSKKENNTDFENTESLRKNLLNAYEECSKEIKDEEKKVTDIEKWENELIAEIYFIPSEYWYDEKKYYSEIKKHPENSEIEDSVIKKTEKLLQDYENQKELILSRIKFLKTLKDKYETLLQKLNHTIKKSLMMKSKDEYIKSIKKYKKRLKDVQNNNEDFHKLYEESEHLKQIKTEIKELEEDFLIKKEVNEYIKKITDKFLDEDSENDNKLLKEEINRLRKDME